MWYSCPVVEAMSEAYSYPKAWPRRNSDVAQPRAMAFVSHVSPGANYVSDYVRLCQTVSDCDVCASHFWNILKHQDLYKGS